MFLTSWEGGFISEITEASATIACLLRLPRSSLTKEEVIASLNPTAPPFCLKEFS